MCHSQADISAAREVLGYRPQVSVEEGLRRTVAWHLRTRAAATAGAVRWLAAR